MVGKSSFQKVSYSALRICLRAATKTSMAYSLTRYGDAKVALNSDRQVNYFVFKE